MILWDTSKIHCAVSGKVLSLSPWPFGAFDHNLISSLYLCYFLTDWLEHICRSGHMLTYLNACAYISQKTFYRIYIKITGLMWEGIRYPFMSAVLLRQVFEVTLTLPPSSSSLVSLIHVWYRKRGVVSAFSSLWEQHDQFVYKKCYLGLQKNHCKRSCTALMVYHSCFLRLHDPLQQALCYFPPACSKRMCWEFRRGLQNI